ncbi:alpha-helical pore-forming toxin family protein [Corallococcus sp. ZKHCc1 1396]|uniref:Alpha-helical pore-forming toxin family protein n=1 Tax=Corallococcus soli TaxID=2710757 RepID=A0ABR9PZ69_9BACT|nr:HBL/NHE enterotoxin family protein [Corallococcus soli]MBE4753235.1 alpha-helical pore-forming toxin family protein [Corallococcus soli]
MTTTATATNAAQTSDTDSDTPDIGGSGLSTGMTDTQTAAAVMQMYTNVVLQTPIMNLPAEVDTLSGSTVVEQLPVDQANAQAHARYYLQTLNPQMVALLATIIGYGNQWNAMYRQLLHLANHIDEGDNQQQFIDGINLLIQKCGVGKDQATATSSALLAFATDSLDADVAAFNQDFVNVNLAYGADSTEITALNQRIAADQKAMDTACWVIAGSAVALGVGSIAVLVGIFAEIPSGGTSTAVVVGGFALAAGGAVVGSLALVDWNNAKDDMVKATNELARDQTLLTTMNTAMLNIQSLSSACAQAASAVQGLANQWTSLAADLQATIDQLEVAEDASSWIASQLMAANADWETTLALAVSIQQNGTLPVQQENYDA